MTEKNASGAGMAIIHDCLLIPISDNMDRQSLLSLSHEVFEKLKESECRKVIINVSAVNVIDSRSFLILSNIAKSVNLMGGKAVFVGIRAGVACSLVELNLDLDQITTAVTTEDAREILDQFRSEKSEKAETENKEQELQNQEPRTGVFSDGDRT